MRIKHVFLAGLDLVLAYLFVYALGPYSRSWGDVALHVLAGAFLVIFWHWISGRYFKKPISLTKNWAGAISTVFLGSLAWEGFEVFLRQIYPSLASALGFNSPENDSFSDVVFALIGGITFLVVTAHSRIRYTIINNKLKKSL